MSSGISYREKAYHIMHVGKRANMALNQVIRQFRIKPAIAKIIKEKYGDYRPRISHHERITAGQTWDYVTRRWVKQP